MRTAFDGFADKGRAVVSALAPVLTPGRCDEPTDPDAGQTIVFEALVALMHYCAAAEVDFDFELREAKDLVAADRREDLEDAGGAA